MNQINRDYGCLTGVRAEICMETRGDSCRGYNFGRCLNEWVIWFSRRSSR